MPKLLYLARFANELTCVACPFCEILTSCDVNVKIYGGRNGYFWCMSCGAKSICDRSITSIDSDDVENVYPYCPALELKNAIFYTTKLRFVTELSGHRMGYLFQTENTIKSRDIVRFFVELENCGLDVEKYVKNNKIARKYKIVPTRFIDKEKMLLISVNNYNLNCPDVPYPKNMDLFWRTSIMVSGHEFFHPF